MSSARANDQGKDAIENDDNLYTKVLQYPPQTENVLSIWIWSFSDQLNNNKGSRKYNNLSQKEM